MKLRIALLFVLCAACARGGEGEATLPATVGELVRTTLEAPVPAEIKGEEERRHVWADMRRFYRQRLWHPAWFDAAGARPAAQSLLDAIPIVAREGIEPAHYRREELAAYLATLQDPASFEDPAVQRRLVAADLRFTYAFMTLAHHLAVGRFKPGSIKAEWYTKPREPNLGELLAAMIEKPEALGSGLEALAPPHEAYGRLRTALGLYRDIAGAGGWPAVPPGPTLKQGATGERVAALRERLAASGDLPGETAAAPAAEEPAGAEPRGWLAKRRARAEAKAEAKAAAEAAAAAAQAPPAVYDEAIGEAVRRFQTRHGLAATGSVGKATLAALNVPAAERARQIEINLERWRWMPGDLGERHIVVNVPAYGLRVVEGKETALAMKVIVGKDQSRTPAFSDQMTYLELNPWWNIPPSIERNEILPKVAADPGYLARNDMEIVSDGGESRIRQRPGPANPLGQIKFMFPNQFNIYLHDTPADHLFDVAERGFSHGCIRIEKPMELAEYLLRGDPKWSRAALQAAIDTGESKSIKLPRPIPVHILYWTAWMEPDGTVQFRDDLYGHDAELEKALGQEPPVDLDLRGLGSALQAAK